MWFFASLTVRASSIGKGESSLRTFKSPRQFAAFLEAAIPRMSSGMREGGHKAGVMLAEEAKNILGSYPPPGPADRFGLSGMLPYDPMRQWQELAPITVHEKTELGYSPPDNPLVRTGEMRDSISYEVALDSRAMMIVVGSDVPYAVDQELGTERIPSRPFLGRAVYEHHREAIQVVLVEMMRPVLR